MTNAVADLYPGDQLTPKQVVARYGIPYGTLANYRWMGTGPKFTKSATGPNGPAGQVTYRAADVEAWLKERSRPLARAELLATVDRLRAALLKIAEIGIRFPCGCSVDDCPYAAARAALQVDGG